MCLMVIDTTCLGKEIDSVKIMCLVISVADINGNVLYGSMRAVVDVWAHTGRGSMVP